MAFVMLQDLTYGGGGFTVLCLCRGRADSNYIKFYQYLRSR